ncbi:MAG TPA: hypothetical protein VGJ79_10265 [Candidatus Dormibacteraeota bacterium]|jgi:hypothetical protein
MPELVELEQQLSRLGPELEWPATPNLAPAISLRIGTPRRPWFESRWALVAAAALLVVAILAAYPPSRDAIAGWLNLHTRFQTVPHLATPSPLPSGPLGQRLGLGQPTSLPAAQSAVTWPLLVPASLGQPDAVYVQPPPDQPPGGEVTLVYAGRQALPAAGETGVGVLITEARGAVNSNFFGKTVGPGTTIEAVIVAGHSGYWIAGAPHVFMFLDSSGSVRYETLRLATNTLLIDEAGTLVRIEGNLTKAQSLEIAASLA